MLALALRSTLLSHSQGYLETEDAISRMIGYFAGGFTTRQSGGKPMDHFVPNYDNLDIKLAHQASEQFGIYYHCEDGHVVYACAEERMDYEKAH